jgi:chromosome segregation ATPase
MVEAAVGLEPFRENVVQAKDKLTKILSQEESVGKLLEQAAQTLNYWREQYEKFQEKKQLQLKRRFLDRELVWAEVEKRECTVKVLQANVNKTQQALGKIEDERQTIISGLDGQSTQQQTLRSEIKTVHDERVSLEHELAQNQTIIELITQLQGETELLGPIANKSQFKLLRTENLREMLQNSKRQIEKANMQVKANQSRLLNSRNTVKPSVITVASHGPT